jgi:tRNA (guanine37-N1)-methyltransferase
MKFTVISLFPEMILQTLQFGLVGQGLEKGLFEVATINPRQFTSGVHKSVDDRPFGGGDGMVLQPEVMQASIERAKSENPGGHVIFLSPQGAPLNENKIQELLQHKSLILVSARYAGMDQRAINSCVDEEISIGDYVLSGGELPALVLIEALSRKISGVLGHADSADKDSFANGLLEAPAFTRPREWGGQPVPEILMSGNHALIEEWRKKISWLVTKEKRPDLFLRALRELQQTDLKAPEFLKKLRDFDSGLAEEERHLCGLKNYKPDSWREAELG